MTEKQKAEILPSWTLNLIGIQTVIKPEGKPVLPYTE